MGKAERGKQPKGDAPVLDEDLDIRATLQQLLVNTKGIPDMNTEMNELKTQIKKTNDVLIPALKGQISTLEKGIKELSGDVEVQDARIEDVEERCSKLEETNQKLQEEVRKLKENPSQHTEVPSDKIIEDRVQIALRQLERQTHLLIDGIAENPNENILEQVGLVLYDTQLNLERNTVLKVYRLGPLNEKSWRPRPVVVEFDCRDTRDLVFKARFNIKSNPNCEKVWINERLDACNDSREWNCEPWPIWLKNNIILGGDFNINFAKNSNHKSTLTRISKRFSLTQYIKEPTRPLYGDNIVDLIFCNSNSVQYTGLLNWNVSDHVPVLINIKKQKTFFEKDKFNGRSYRLFNEDRFVQDLSVLITAEHLNLLANVNDKWDFFFNTVKNSLDIMCPVREFSFKKEKPPWLTHDLIERSQRRKMIKQMRGMPGI